MAEDPATRGPLEPTISEVVWRWLESQPGFNEQLRAAEAELEAGGGVLFEVVDGELREVEGQ